MVLQRTILLLALLMLAACSIPYNFSYKKKTPGGHYKVGQPYEIDGTWYTPREEHDYNEVGISSWYGSDFHDKRTANGDIFDKNALTAAHRTLPMPSMVRVTNLENGRTLILMVNDRGPFAKGRILDVSERASEILGFKHKGIAKVRVTYLPGQSKRLLADLNASQGDIDLGNTPEVADFAGPQIAKKPQGFLDRLAYVLGKTPKPAQTAKDPSPIPSTTPSSHNNGTMTLGQMRTLEKLEQRIAKTEQISSTFDTARTPAPSSIQDTPSPEEEAMSQEITSEPAPVAIQESPAMPTQVLADDSASSVPSSTLAPPPTEVASLSNLPLQKVMPEPSIPRHYVQVGAYGVRDNAERVANEIAILGNVNTDTLDTGQRELYRVRLGPLYDKTIANALLTKVVTMGHVDAVIIDE